MEPSVCNKTLKNLKGSVYNPNIGLISWDIITANLAKNCQSTDNGYSTVHYSSALLALFTHRWFHKNLVTKEL